MANIKSQMKRIKTNDKARMRNKMHKSDLKTALKKLDVLINEDIAKAQEFLPTVHKKIDAAISKGIIHKNKAKRLKSKVDTKINNAK